MEQFPLACGPVLQVSVGTIWLSHHIRDEDSKDVSNIGSAAFFYTVS